MLLDIDHFKRINDTFGHDAGDAVLVEIAQLVRKEVRGTDHVARWGGEELLILVPQTPLTAVLVAMERLCQTIRERTHIDGQPVTASFGIAQWVAEDTSSTLVSRADTALYAAKAAGRDQVCCAPLQSPTG